MNINIEIHLSESCNLNCSCCAHFAQIAEEEYLNPSDFEKSLSSINSEVLNSFGIMRLMGGEPLLNKDVKEIICIARKYFHNKIELITNGILLGKQDNELFRVCARNNVEIAVTKYPIHVFDDEQARILSAIFHLRIFTFQYIGQFYHHKIDISGSQDKEKNYHRCPIVQTQHCQQLVGTKLYTCSYGAYIRHFNKRFGYNLSDEEYIDLSNVENVCEIEEWYKKSKNFCSHCDLDNTKLYPWALHDRNGDNEYIV